MYLPLLCQCSDFAAEQDGGIQQRGPESAVKRSEKSGGDAVYGFQDCSEYDHGSEKDVSFRIHYHINRIFFILQPEYASGIFPCYFSENENKEYQGDQTSGGKKKYLFPSFNCEISLHTFLADDNTRYGPQHCVDC